MAPSVMINVVIKNASKDFQPIAQRTIQAHETDGGGDDETHCGARLTDEPGGELRYELAGGGDRVLGLRGGAHEARTDDHAVGPGVGRLGGVLGGRDAEAERDRDVGVALDAAEQLAEGVLAAGRARRSSR